jgi:hypothetical protein
MARNGDTDLQHFTPDALQDSTRTRYTRANRRLNFGGGLLPRLLIAGKHDLQHVVLPLGPGTAADLYAPATGDRARAAVLALVGPSPTWACLELGMGGKLHAHVLTSADARLLMPTDASRKPVDAPLGLMRYLSKPADARACMRRNPRTGITSAPDPDQLREATSDYMTARARGRLPRLSWTANLARLKPDEVDQDVPA